MEKAPSILTTEEDGAVIVEFRVPQILDEEVIDALGEQLGRLVVSRPQPRLVLDFTHVTHMSSTALGMLITLHKDVRERGGYLRLCGFRPEIYEVFVITKLNELFQIHSDRASALASLR